MQILIVIIAVLFGQQSSRDLHGLLNEVRELQISGDYTEALSKYESLVKPKLKQAPKNLEINARLIEVLLFRKTGQTQRGLDSLEYLLPIIPDSLPVHKMQALSHKSTLQYDAERFNDYYETLDSLYSYAKRQGDGDRANRALGNMYYYFDEKNDQERLENHLVRLEEHLLNNGSDINELRYFLLKGRFERDYRNNVDQAIRNLGKAKDQAKKSKDFAWLEIVVYEQVITWLKAGNYKRAARELEIHLARPGTNQNPNSIYSAYSAMVRIHAYQGDLQLAKQYMKLMNRIPKKTLNIMSIEAGVYAKIAMKGGDSWKTDPLLRHAEKSKIGLPGLAGILIAVSILFYGLLIIYKTFLKRPSTTLLTGALRWSHAEL